MAPFGMLVARGHGSECFRGVGFVLLGAIHHTFQCPFAFALRCVIWAHAREVFTGVRGVFVLLEAVSGTSPRGTASSTRRRWCSQAPWTRRRAFTPCPSTRRAGV